MRSFLAVLALAAMAPAAEAGRRGGCSGGTCGAATPIAIVVQPAQPVVSAAVPPVAACSSGVQCVSVYRETRYIEHQRVRLFGRRGCR